MVLVVPVLLLMVPVALVVRVEVMLLNTLLQEELHPETFIALVSCQHLELMVVVVVVQIIQRLNKRLVEMVQ
jgi:hypothetical protein